MEPKQIEPYVWEIPMGYVDGMNVPGRVFASKTILEKAMEDRALEQVANVATLPGIVGTRWRCPTSTGVTASRSAVSRRPMATPERSRREESDSTSVAAFDYLRSDLTWNDVAPRIRRGRGRVGTECSAGCRR